MSLADRLRACLASARGVSIEVPKALLMEALAEIGKPVTKVGLPPLLG